MFSSGWPATKRLSCAAISRSARGKKAELAPPTCGEISAPGWRQSGWSGGQRLRVGHVERRADPSGFQLGDQRIRVDQLAAGHVDQQRAVRQQRQFAGADHALGLRGVRGDDERDVGLRQQPVQVLDRVHLRRPGPGPPGHPGDRGDLEPVQPVLDRLPDVPVPDDQDPLVGQGPAEREPPRAAGLVAGELVQVPAAGQGEGYRELGRAGVVQPGRVAQRHPGRHQRQELLVAGREGLHHLQLGHVGGPVEDGRPLHVGQDVEGDLVEACREARPRPRGRSRAPGRPGCRSGGVRLRRGRCRAPRRAAWTGPFPSAGVVPISNITGPCGVDAFTSPGDQISRFGLSADGVVISPNTMLSQCTGTPEGLAGEAADRGLHQCRCGPGLPLPRLSPPLVSCSRRPRSPSRTRSCSGQPGHQAPLSLPQGWSGQSGRRVRSGQPADPGLIAAAPRPARRCSPVRRKLGNRNAKLGNAPDPERGGARHSVAV